MSRRVSSILLRSAWISSRSRCASSRAVLASVDRGVDVVLALLQALHHRLPGELVEDGQQQQEDDDRPDRQVDGGGEDVRRLGLGADLLQVVLRDAVLLGVDGRIKRPLQILHGRFVVQQGCARRPLEVLAPPFFELVSAASKRSSLTSFFSCSRAAASMSADGASARSRAPENAASNASTTPTTRHPLRMTTSPQGSGVGVRGQNESECGVPVFSAPDPDPDPLFRPPFSTTPADR